MHKVLATCVGGAIVPGSDYEVASTLHRIGGPGGVVLELLVSPALAADLIHPLRECRSWVGIKYILYCIRTDVSAYSAPEKE
jgi:hypothetical protein